MEFYSKQEFNQMKRSLERVINSQKKEIEKLKNQNKSLKEDYEILLETASEKEDIA